jgi:hypothetical protein
VVTDAQFAAIARGEELEPGSLAVGVSLGCPVGEFSVVIAMSDVLAWAERSQEWAEEKERLALLYQRWP